MQGRVVLKIRIVKVMLFAIAALAVSSIVSLSASAQTVRYIHTDGLGSVVLITDKDRNIVERSEYEPYGILLNRPITDRPGYAGHVMDAATELSYMQQRYYDPKIGRFLSVDPVSADTVTGWNFNRYNYGANNPYKFTDPDGRTVTCSETRCTGESHSILEAIVDTGTVALVYITRLAQNAVDSIQQQEQASEPTTEGERELGDLEPIHAPDHPQNNPEISGLSDEELGEAINNPANGERVTVRGNKVLNGNTRINEAKGRGWPDNTKIPVDELPELPDNIDQDPLGPYGDL
jgi:RHS repeat-associated protein